MLRLTEKDYLLFRYLFEHEWVSQDLIKDYIWKDLVSPSYVNKRLWMLTGGKQGKENREWVHKYNHTWLKNKIYQASQTCEGVLQNNDSFYDEIINSTRPDMNDQDIEYSKFPRQFYKHSKEEDINVISFEHDYAVLKTRLVFEKLGLAKDWVTEQMIWSESYSRKFNKEKEKLGIIPDAVFTFKGEEKDYRIALEMEYTRKSKSTYKEKIEKYDNGNIEVDIVMWVYTSNEILNLLTAGIESEVNQSGVSFERGISSIFVDYSDIKKEHYKHQTYKEVR